MQDRIGKLLRKPLVRCLPHCEWYRCVYFGCDMEEWCSYYPNLMKKCCDENGFVEICPITGLSPYEKEVKDNDTLGIL